MRPTSMPTGRDYDDFERDPFDPDDQMACETGKMTAAEEVLADLLINEIGCVDDETYTPNQAREIIIRKLREGRGRD